MIWRRTTTTHPEVDELSVEVLGADVPGHDSGTHTRGELLERAVVAGGAVAAGGVLVVGLPRLAISAPSRKQDAKVLNFVLLIESLQAAFYAEALRNGKLTGEWRQFARVVGRQERAHLAYLKRTLGADARSIPRFKFGDSTKSVKKFSAAAVALEDMGLAAYNGQATNLTGRALRAAGKITSVEARHASWARDIAGENPAPRATDLPASEAKVTAALRRQGLLK
jgi:ferritin-like protein